MPQPARSSASGGDRSVSLDTYRGFIMLAMISAGLGTRHLLNDATWGWLAAQLEHRAWEGCTFWDLIQPSFLFIVGVAMPFSYSSRQGQGQSFLRQLAHALTRSAILILIGWFLDAFTAGLSASPPRLERFRLADVRFLRVLQQIAIGYLLAFFILPLGPKVQAAGVVFFLTAHTAAYLTYARVMQIAPWEPGHNFGSFLDMVMRRPAVGGHYVTFNAISSTATILLGVLCGELLRGPVAPGRKVAIMFGAGLALLAAGWGLSGGNGWVPISFPTLVPMVKRLWTASFAIHAAGWTFLMMGLFYLIIDVMMVRFWTLPFVVVGMNSIFIYIASEMLARPIVHRAVAMFVADPGTTTPAYKPVLMSLVSLTIFWLICVWLYRRKVFIKV